ncbi:hypothetical protein [Paraclostridium benzoelyticum]|nr:hypothetical protein [Paraclostridium benzoelyticum]
MKLYLLLVPIIISIFISSLSTVILTSSPDIVSFMGSFLGSIISVAGAYWIFSMDGKQRDKEDLECLLSLLKFTVMKVDRVLVNFNNIKLGGAVNITQFAHELVYDKEWYKYLRLIDRYEDKESIIKFFDYIQRDKNMMLGDLITYRYSVVDILKRYDKYDVSLDKDELYLSLNEKYSN